MDEKQNLSIFDIALELKAKLEKKPKPGQFITEKDLPIVEESRQILKNSREQGNIITEPEQPLGEINNLLLYWHTDLHQPTSNPHLSVESRSPVLRAVAIEAGPKSVAGHLKGMDWYHEERPAVSFEAFFKVREAIAHDIQRRGLRYADSDSAIIDIDGGDSVYNDATIADVAAIGASYEDLRFRAQESLNEVMPKTTKTTLEEAQEKLEKRRAFIENKRKSMSLKPHQHIELTQVEIDNLEATQKVYLAKLKGNHESDQINNQLNQEAEERKLFGAQIFYQEVGKEHAFLALNTNFSSDYWQKYYKLSKQTELNDEDRELIRIIEEEIKLQKHLIEKALSSGRKLIVAGHQRDQIERMIDLPNSRVARILSGHIGPELKDRSFGVRNKDGDLILETRSVGALEGIPAWEKGDAEDIIADGYSFSGKKTDTNPEPAVFAVEIFQDTDGNEDVKVEKIKIPTLKTK